MNMPINILVPDVGDHHDIPVIELLVKPGDIVEKDQGLITLESDKATMEVPSPMSGKVVQLTVKLGDKVSQGTTILHILPINNPPPSTDTSDPSPNDAQALAPALPPSSSTNHKIHDCDVLVLGAGPGGYTAAFRAADLGLKVILVEKHKCLGGVCLNVGCIPSKALLHIAQIINDSKDAASHGIVFGKPAIDLDKIRTWKNNVTGKLTKGLEALAKQRKVTVVHGSAQFVDSHHIEVNEEALPKRYSFQHAIIATGSHSAKIPGISNLPSVMDSTGALMLDEIPTSLLIIGGGIIGLEMATVYATLGSTVTIVELMDGLIPGADRDLVRPMQKRLVSMGVKIYLNTKVEKTDQKKDGVKVTFSVEKGIAPSPQTFSRVLLSVGRRPNGNHIGAHHAGVQVDERGFIRTNPQMRTNVPHIFAIGDVVGDPMLAHKATHEAKIAAETIAGHKVAFEPISIPSVAYTDPEIAWVGLTETQAQKENIVYEKAVFPWLASGRALSMARTEGSTKLLFDPTTKQILGGGIVGRSAGDLIGELCLAVEHAVDIADISLTIHPHPTLCETIGFSAEVAEGSITDIYIPKRTRPT